MGSGADGRCCRGVCLRRHADYFFAKDFVSSFLLPLSKMPVTSVGFDNFQDATFSVDKNLIEEIFSKELTNNIDYNHLSIEEIWFATV